MKAVAQHLTLVLESKAIAEISHNQEVVRGGQELCKNGVTWLDAPTQVVRPFWKQTQWAKASDPIQFCFKNMPINTKIKPTSILIKSQDLRA